MMMMMMMTMMMIIIIIIIIIMMMMMIIAFNGAIREFFYNLTAQRTISNTYAQVPRAQSCANHVQHIQGLSRATCRVTCHAVRRDSSAPKFDRVEIALIYWFFFIGWTINRWRRGGNRSTRRKPLAMSLGKCHLLKLEDSNPKRDYDQQQQQQQQ